MKLDAVDVGGFESNLRAFVTKQLKQHLHIVVATDLQFDSSSYFEYTPTARDNSTG